MFLFSRATLAFIFLLSAFASGFSAYAVDESLRLKMETELSNGGRFVRLQYVDGCNRPISYTTQNYLNKSRKSPVSLSLELFGLAPDKKVWLEVEFTLLSSKPHNQLPIKFQGEYKADRAGEAYWKFPIRFLKSSNTDIWQARVTWSQPDSLLNNGSFHTSLMVFNHREELKKFYRIVSVAQCQWESPVAIASAYYWNGEAAPLHINRSEQFSASSIMRNGFDLGMQVMGGGDKPLVNSHRDYGEKYNYNSNLPRLPFIPQSGAVLWFFSGWQRVMEMRSSFGMDRLWSLKPAEGAFYGIRTSFTRYEAIEFTERDLDGCRDLVPTRKGWLDVGLQSTNLYAVPLDLSGSPEEARRFMELVQPAVNSCGEQIPGQGGAEYKVTGDTESVLFFYPGNN